jgi:Rad3-related DNA helicase
MMTTPRYHSSGSVSVAKIAGGNSGKSLRFMVGSAEIPVDPGAWDIPHDKWREGQIMGMAAVSGIIDKHRPDRWTSNPPVLIYEGPTGSGKSGFAMGVDVIAGGVAVTTHTTDLQAQYRDAYGIPTIMGKARYHCTNEDWRAVWRNRYGRRINSHGVEEPTADDCRLDSPNMTNEACLECEYLVAKGACIAERRALLNVHYAYYTTWWRRMGLGAIACDEVHGLPEVLASLSNVVLTGKNRQTYGWPKYPDANGSSQLMYGRLADWIPGALEATKDSMAITEAVSDPAEFKRLERKTDLLTQKLKWLARRLRKAEDNDFYLRSANGEMLVRTTDVTGSFGDLVSHTKYVRSADQTPDPPKIIVLMSATIGDPIALTEELGLTNRDVYFYSAPATFPADRRPVFFWKKAPGISYRSSTEDWEYVISKMDLIMDMYPNERGLIHVSSWKQADMIVRLTRHKDRVRTPNRGISRAAAVQQFITGPPNGVIVSPSWGEGLDFPDDYARFCILGKVKFLSLRDPIVGMKLKQPGGQRWYNWKAANSAVQSAGRIMRHSKDWGETWIVDGHWRRVQKHVPQWFVVQDVDL